MDVSDLPCPFCTLQVPPQSMLRVGTHPVAAVGPITWDNPITSPPGSTTPPKSPGVRGAQVARKDVRSFTPPRRSISPQPKSPGMRSIVGSPQPNSPGARGVYHDVRAVAPPRLIDSRRSATPPRLIGRLSVSPQRAVMVAPRVMCPVYEASRALAVYLSVCMLRSV